MNGENNVLSKSPLTIGLALAVLGLAFLIIRPLLTPILSGLILAYLFHPVYQFLLSRIGGKNPNRGKTSSALLIIVIIICVFLAPLWLLLMLLMFNFQELSSFINQLVPALTDFVTHAASRIDQKFLAELGLNFNAASFFSLVSKELLAILQSLFTQLPAFFLGSFIALFIVYYLLKQSEDVLCLLSGLVPLKQEIIGDILKRFNHLGRGLIASQFIIAVIQGALMAIAMLILGMKHLVLITLLTVVLAIVPFMGAVVVWVTMSVYLFVQYLNGLTPLWQPIFLLAYGFLLVSLVDNVVRPKILADASKINPAIVLVGFIGGLMLFGIPGIFLGP
ncbi:MAG: AI-2E family transporter, partial [Candidatus Margulisiibacteriota bacterium]